MKPKIFTLIVILWALRGSAQINAYAAVTAISSKTLTLSSASVNQTYHSFAAGDQIILMQMQDVVVGSNTTNTASYGNISAIANAGRYEVLTIASIAGLPNSITVSVAPSSTYHFGSGCAVQIISFRKYGSPDYTTTANMTALAWNGTVGGVIALQVTGTLTLANSINADAAGFRGGGTSSNYEVNCEPTVYASTSTNYATKGEGIQANNTGFLYGRNALANGGGGGSDDNAGGGGGSNVSAGGQGGAGWTCSASPSGGFGGNTLFSYITGNRVFMGGGGGGGQQNNGVGTAGGRGGGIVIIKAQTLKTSCSGSINISANGVTAATSGNDGAGGGGAGGSVVMSVVTFTVGSSCPLNVNGSGGNGGSVNDAGAHGGGAGGGQGAIIYPATVPTTNITNTTNSGTGGANNNSGTGGYAGGGSGSSNAGVMQNNGYIVLPVQISEFTASLSDVGVRLKWQAPVEATSDRFEIQRSSNNNDFATIGTVAAGASSQYVYADASPENGVNYYRLRQIDIDGKESYSTVLLVDVAVSTRSASLSVYPNPIDRAFTIKLQTQQSTLVSLSLSDLSGRTILVSSGYANGGLMNVTLDKKPSPGIYILTAQVQQERFTTKVLVK